MKNYEKNNLVKRIPEKLTIRQVNMWMISEQRQQNNLLNLKFVRILSKNNKITV